MLPIGHDVKPLPMRGNYLFLNDILKSVHIVNNTILQQYAVQGHEIYIQLSQ